MRNKCKRDFEKTIIVEAKNKKEAIERVEDAIWRSEIILDADDFDERVVPHLSTGLMWKFQMGKMLVAMNSLQWQNTQTSVVSGW
ncbi:hypothetical protein D7Y41_33445 [Anaerotruncus sp. 1XD22-93]|nr:hypothetical protein [Lachnospiraceae bacterium]NBI76839.1 hypothetical protein [Lachnospiraceae bacterium]RKJ75269.1 hypothetical protein D7Y41_33445 [Anaerotruncus sp. 1XD22-93]